MSDGKPSEPRLGIEQTDALRPELLAFAKWLLSDEQVLEVWGLAGAKSANVECVTDTAQSLELDSGDWFLVRVSGVPTTPGASGIVRFQRSGHRKDD